MNLLSLVIGFVVGAVAVLVLAVLAVRRARNEVAREVAEKDGALAELRREASEDRETNRRLRHEMHGLRAGRAVSALASTGSPDQDQDSDSSEPIGERDLDDVDQLRAALAEAQAQVGQREAKLRRYREALTEIRLSLETRDPLNQLVPITEEIPVTRPSDTSDVA